MSVERFVEAEKAGWTVKIKPIMPFNMVEPGATAKHEALHTVAAILTGDKVIDATRIPGDGFKGRTRLTRFSGIAFVAAHARGSDGAGHDLWVLRSLGHDVDLLAGEARSVLSGHDEEIHAVASLIEEKGTISGYEAEMVMDRVNNPEVEINIINPLGQQRCFVSKIRTSGDYFIPIDLAA